MLLGNTSDVTAVLSSCWQGSVSPVHPLTFYLLGAVIFQWPEVSGEASGYHRSYQIKECDGCLKYVLEFQHNVFLKIFVFRKVIHQFKFNFLHLVVVKPRPQEIMLYSQEHTRKGIGESYILNAKKNTQKLFYFFHFLCTFKNLRKCWEMWYLILQC